MDDDYYYWPDYQQYSMATVPRVAGLLSVTGSLTIILECWLDWFDGKDTPISRLLVSLSVADLLFSTAWIISTSASPSELEYVKGNVGTSDTCVVQGFIYQLGLVSEVFSNVSLALFYVLMVRFEWSNKRVKKIETLIHSSIWLIALACAIYPIPLQMYNNTWFFCWIESYPLGCDDLGIECTRGKGASMHALVFSLLPLLCIAAAILAVAFIFTKLRKSTTETSSSNLQEEVQSNPVVQEQSVMSSDIENVKKDVSRKKKANDKKQKKLERQQKSKRLAGDAFWYIGAYCLCYFPDIFASIMYYVFGVWWFQFVVFAFFLLPLQGFMNFLVFARNRKMKSSSGRFLKRILLCSTKTSTPRRVPDNMTPSSSGET